MKSFYVTVRSVIVVKATDVADAERTVNRQLEKYKGVVPDGIGAQILTGAEIADDEEITEII